MALGGELETTQAKFSKGVACLGSESGPQLSAHKRGLVTKPGGVLGHHHLCFSGIDAG